MKQPASQTTRILRHLMRGRSLTPLAALNEYGCFRLSARILDLRKAGHQIGKRTAKTNNGKRVAAYFMDGGAA
jgi:hypothetical protein